MQPVTLTAKVPASAPVGEYTGALSLEVDGSEVTVRVSLKVCGYRVPDPRDHTMWLSLNSSPETVAVRFDAAGEVQE